MLIGHVPLQYEEALFEFLCKHESDTVIDKSDSIGCCNSTEFEIELIDQTCAPVQHDARRCSRLKQEFIDEQIDKMLSMDIIEPTLSDWTSGVVVAPKPGPGDDYRFCVDLQDVNDRTRKIKFPLPNIEEILQNLGGACYFMKLDLAKGYWQVPVAENSRKYLTFITRRGTYRYKRMPFGPTNAPAIFQAMMNQALGDALYKTSFVYLDDIVVFAKDIPELLRRGDYIIDKLRSCGLKLNGLKSEFILTELELLGRIVKDGKVYPKLDKLQGLKDLKVAKDVSEVRSIYGLLSYYRHFVPKFSVKAKAITDCLRKTETAFKWTFQCQQAVNNLLDEISDAALLLPKWGEPFIVQTDFSYNGIGAVISQLHEGKEHPILFASRTLIEAERNYSPTEGEALAILFALKRFQYLLQGQQVIIKTDHKPLEFVKGGSENNRKLARWWAELQQFDYTIQYLPGRSNLVPDTLSRMTNRDEEPRERETLGFHYCECRASTFRCEECGGLEDENLRTCDLCSRQYHDHCQLSRTFPGNLPFWYCRHCVHQLHSGDPALDIGLLQFLATGALEGSLEERRRIVRLAKVYNLINDKLFRQDGFNMQEVISPIQRLDVLQDIHVESGHVGITKLYKTCKRYYYWPHLVEDCAKVVRTCRECQLHKAKPRYLPLQPTNKYQQPYQVWSIDLLPMLPITTEGYRHCLIMVDAFSKWVELVPLKSKESIEVADAIKLHLIARFGLPREIRCDRGREFTGALSQLCQQYQIKQIFISRLHPQANGQAERYVGVCKTAIAKLLKTHGWTRGDWVQCLPACLMGLRFFEHRVLGLTPFTLCCGTSPNWPSIPYSSGGLEEWTPYALEQFLNQLLAQVGYIHEVNVLRLAMADLANEAYFNAKKRLLSEFKEGDLVMMKSRTNLVLELPMLGPFKFVRYRNAAKNSACIVDADGNELTCSVSHLLPYNGPEKCVVIENLTAAENS